MVVVAVIRELLGSASIAGMDIAFLANYKISALAKAPGAYIVLAIVAAVVSKMGMGKEKEDK
jgi:Na+-transporting NADH:ubiquinone oxidoreductase subunit NqrD